MARLSETTVCGQRDKALKHKSPDSSLHGRSPDRFVSGNAGMDCGVASVSSGCARAFVSSVRQQTWPEPVGCCGHVAGERGRYIKLRSARSRSRGESQAVRPWRYPGLYRNSGGRNFDCNRKKRNNSSARAASRPKTPENPHQCLSLLPQNVTFLLPQELRQCRSMDAQGALRAARETGADANEKWRDCATFLSTLFHPLMYAIRVASQRGVPCIPHAVPRIA